MLVLGILFGKVCEKNLHFMFGFLGSTMADGKNSAFLKVVKRSTEEAGGSKKKKKKEWYNMKTQ